MTLRALSLLLLSLSLTTPLVSWGQAGGDRIAGELNALRQQQRQVSRNIEQYETSISLLRANQAPGAESPALQTLEEQLGQSRQQLLELTEKESALLAQLMPEKVATVAIQNDNSYFDPEAEEVARLKKLLQDYYSAEAKAEAEAAAGVTADAAVSQEAVDYPVERVRLTGNEGIAAIQQISHRLADDSMPAQRREIDIIFHIEVRDEGTLVSSSSHSLKSLGKSQYVSKVSLRGGRATITVRKDSWIADLSVADAADYLITLNTPRGRPPELHVIPVEELKATHWTELPPWLPYIGAVPPPPAQS